MIINAFFRIVLFLFFFINLTLCVLYWPIFSQRVRNFLESGMYIDFIFKKIAELIGRNLFVYTSIFFLEKFIIEYLTKNYFDWIIISIGRRWSDYYFKDAIIYNLVLIYFYTLIIIELFYLL